MYMVVVVDYGGCLTRGFWTTSGVPTFQDGGF